MDKEILNALGLADNADSKAIVNAISAITKKVSEKETVIEGLNAEIVNKSAEIESLQGKVSAFEQAEQARKAREAKEVVNAAVAARKIAKDAAEKWEKLYLENPELAKETLNSLSVNPKLSEITQGEPTGETKIKLGAIANVMAEIDAKTRK